MKKRKLQWHPAFGAALRITLKDEMEFLEMQEEYLLSKKPPQIDILIVKKLRDRPIKKAIGKIFRQHNIIEYKAPDDYLSINDFYKVYGYTCFYQSNTDRIKEIDPEELTITARAEDQEIMAVEHKKYPVYGLQFHPESVLTPEGKKMIQNFVEVYRHD